MTGIDDHISEIPSFERAAETGEHDGCEPKGGSVDSRHHLIVIRMGVTE